MPNLYTNPEFYREVLIAFCKSRYDIDVEDRNTLFNQIIWGNRLFLLNGKCLYCPVFIECGIIYVRDVLQENGYFMQNIYERLNKKTSYLRIINMIKEALRPYRQIRFLGRDEYSFLEPFLDIEGKRSKWFYKELLKKKS